MADVLVVDSGELGELLAALLEQYGMEASRARSGEEALELALAERPRVAIIEHDLPDAAGVDVAELLRTELEVQVILTYAQGLVADGDDVFMQRLGLMDASFARPFRSLTLVQCAARLLGVELPAIGGGVSALASSGAAAEQAAANLSSTEGPAILDSLDDASAELLLDVDAAVEGGAGAPVHFGNDDERTRPGFVIVTGEQPPQSAAGPAPPLEERLAQPIGALGELWRKVQQRRAAPREDRRPAQPGAEMPLSPRALADMLDAFHQSQTTGELWLTHERAKRVLLIRRGVIVGARSNIEAEDLTTLAIRRGALRPEEAAAIRGDVVAGRKRTIVDAIIGRGLLPEAPLRALVEEHARRIALGAFTWQSGGMRVTLEGRAAREAVAVRVPVGDLIVRGILLTEGDDALRAAAPDDARFSPAADSGYGLEDLALSSEEARAVISMDGTKTVKDLILLFDPVIPARTIRGLAAGLLCLNLVRFAGRGPAEARRISFF